MILPPNIAHLAARAKAADSLGLRYTDVTITALEGAVTEATLLVDTVAGLEAKLLASYEAWDKLYAVANRVDFDASESAVPEDQDTWIEFIRGIQDALEPLVNPMEAELAAAKVEV